MKQYTLYIGHNDRETGKQEINDERIIKEIQSALIDAGLVYHTISACVGCYKTEKEKSTRVEILGTASGFDYTKAILKAIKKIKKALNQESVLLNVVDIQAMFK